MREVYGCWLSSPPLHLAVKSCQVLRPLWSATRDPAVTWTHVFCSSSEQPGEDRAANWDPIFHPPLSCRSLKSQDYLPASVSLYLRPAQFSSLGWEQNSKKEGSFCPRAAHWCLHPLPCLWPGFSGATLTLAQISTLTSLLGDRKWFAYYLWSSVSLSVIWVSGCC